MKIIKQAIESLTGINEEEKTTYGSGGLIGNNFHRSFLSLCLTTITPMFVISLWNCVKNFNGSINSFLNVIIVTKGKIIFDMWPSAFDSYALQMIFCFMTFQLVLLKLVPGKVFRGNATATGHVPVYNANGFQCYVINIVTLFALSYLNIFNPSDVYDNLGKLLSSMNLFAFSLCVFLTIKGLNFPSTKDFGSSGNLIIDFFWGTELYPRVFGFDIKQFTNCRFGMMFWQIGIICYGFKQYEFLNGRVSSSILVSIILQSVYIAKFFYWETGYFCSMDIQHDRAGYYLCWGCLVWVPLVYSLHTFFMVEHPVYLSLPTSLCLLAAGLLCIWCNYDCDRQRQEFRSSGGKSLIWGKEPTYIVASYKTVDGENRSSLLLYSGWWGIARHFHYIPEISASFFWCCPSLFSHALPYFYPIYLTVLLVDRAWRDDARCSDKYKSNWDLYCRQVPYKIIPGVI